jgi:hypothetical protein
MAFLPNNPNGVNVAPSANTKPMDGFWSERDVTWLALTATYTLGGTLYEDAFEKPWSIAGYTENVTNVLEDRGTIIGMYNNQPAPLGSQPVGSTGEGGTLYIALGHAAGYFTPGSITTGTKDAGGVLTFVGTKPDPTNPALTVPFVDPVSEGIIAKVLADYPYVPATLEILVGNGFVVL